MSTQDPSNLGPLDGHVRGNILAGLCLSPNIGQYHWLIYLCEDERTGTKFHAHNRLNTEPWRYECQEWNALQSATCVALTKIGRLRAGLGKNDMDAVLKDIPMAVPDRDRPKFRTFTCRVWFREALRRLHIAGLINLTYPNFDLDTRIDALEGPLLTKAVAVEFRSGRDDQAPVIMRPSDLTMEM